MKTIKVSGMSCGHCVASVTKALEEIDRVCDISVDLASGLVQYKTTADVDTSVIKNAILKIGFTPED